MGDKNEIPFGVLSLFLVVITLCLNVFAILSLSTANANLKFTAKSNQNTIDYYAAECEAQQMFIEVDNMLEEGSSPKQIADKIGASLTESGDMIITKLVNSRHSIEIVLSFDEKNYDVEKFALKAEFIENEAS